uniref:Uncharacterized protein n=1 Tax=Picea glauca TaxID=3330 RepID=A0A101M5R9_PICGL|nr:hypothetical protein ABT39_MTgene1224 [Picea glauca]
MVKYIPCATINLQASVKCSFCPSLATLKLNSVCDNLLLDGVITLEGSPLDPALIHCTEIPSRREPSIHHRKSM